MSRRMTLQILLIGLLVTTLLGATTDSRRAKSGGPASQPSSATREEARASGLAQVQGQVERRRLVRIFVHADDIYPDVVRLKPGKVLLLAENETQSDVSLVVEKVNPGQPAQRTAQVRTRQLDKRNRQEMTLGAGEYVFYEESNPRVKGKIIVEPD